MKQQSKQINFKLDEHLYNKLKEFAKGEKKSVQYILTESLISMMARSEQPENRSGRFTFIDLFAGIGGMRIAFERQEGVCVFSSEWDKYAQKLILIILTCYRREISPKSEPKIFLIMMYWLPDFPVSHSALPAFQKNSLGRATGFQDKTQGTLFFDVCRILEAKRPKAFLLENVKNLKSHDHGNTWRVIQESLNQLDYEIFPRIIDGKGFVPQHRERIFIVGFDRRRYGNFYDFTFDIEDQKASKKPVLRDILEDHPDENIPYLISYGRI